MDTPLSQSDLLVATLGPRQLPSPLALATAPSESIAGYVPDEARVALHVETVEGRALSTLLLEKAGPRDRIFFDPEHTRAAIVTCGGLCPGINNVIRSLVLELFHKYGVRDIVGFKYGYEGLAACADPSVPGPVPLGPDEVRSIHKQGGSLLGLARGAQPSSRLVDALLRHRVDILFAIGGDGTLRGAHAIAEEVARRGLGIGVVGVPKTIDNDVPLVDKTFGFDTAVEVARLAVDAAHTEAVGARNGVAVVKLMGRDAGFIAAHASIASADVNFCLVPEVPFDLDGPGGLFEALEDRLVTRGHAVIVVAEGCINRFSVSEQPGSERDASGNLRYVSGALDVGPLLRDAIMRHFKRRNLDASVKYIDPSYMIRSVPANASDSMFCDNLARHAVHAGMAGKTDLMIGRRHRVFTHVPLALVGRRRKRLKTDGPLWLSVTETTGQPSLRGLPRG